MVKNVVVLFSFTLNHISIPKVSDFEIYVSVVIDVDFFIFLVVF